MLVGKKIRVEYVAFGDSWNGGSVHTSQKKKEKGEAKEQADGEREERTRQEGDSDRQADTGLEGRKWNNKSAQQHDRKGREGKQGRGARAHRGEDDINGVSVAFAERVLFVFVRMRRGERAKARRVRGGMSNGERGRERERERESKVSEGASKKKGNRDEGKRWKERP